MFKFFKHGSTTGHGALDSRPGPAPSVPAPSGDSVRPHGDIQRELVRAVLKDTMRRHGIPFEWLSCEVVTMVHGPGPQAQELHIQLTLVQWHELFLRYAPALEHQLLRGLDRYEPSVDHSKYTISWRFAPDCGCPFHVLPPPLVWSHDPPPEPPAPEEAPSVLDRRRTTRPPKAAASNKPPKKDDGDYQRTELSPFR